MTAAPLFLKTLMAALVKLNPALAGRMTTKALLGDTSCTPAVALVSDMLKVTLVTPLALYSGTETALSTSPLVKDSVPEVA